MHSMTNLHRKRILFLSLSGIGNLVMQLPAIRAVKKAHPNWHVTVAVAPRGTKVLAQAQPEIDDVIEMNVSNASPGQSSMAMLQTHIRNIRLLRSNAFDIAVVLSPGQLIKSASYLFVAGIPVRIGHTYPFRGNPHTKLFLTDTVDEEPDMHDMEQNLRLTMPLGVPIAHVPFYALHIPDENKQEAEEILSSVGVDAQKRESYIGIHTGSAPGFEIKRWPLDRFAAVALALMNTYPNTGILVFGGNNEERQKQELIEMINKSAPSSAFSVSASLLTSAAVMEHCRLVVSNDSGLMHIGAALMKRSRVQEEKRVWWCEHLIRCPCTTRS